MRRVRAEACVHTARLIRHHFMILMWLVGCGSCAPLTTLGSSYRALPSKHACAWDEKLRPGARAAMRARAERPDLEKALLATALLLLIPPPSPDYRHWCVVYRASRCERAGCTRSMMPLLCVCVVMRGYVYPSTVVCVCVCV